VFSVLKIYLEVLGKKRKLKN